MSTSMDSLKPSTHPLAPSVTEASNDGCDLKSLFPPSRGEDDTVDTPQSAHSIVEFKSPIVSEIELKDLSTNATKDVKAHARFSKTKHPTDLDLINRTIGTLQAGGRASRAISKRDAMTFHLKKRGRRSKKPYVCPGKNTCKSVLCSHPYDSARLEQQNLYGRAQNSGHQRLK